MTSTESHASREYNRMSCLKSRFISLPATRELLKLSAVISGILMAGIMHVQRSEAEPEITPKVYKLLHDRKEQSHDVWATPDLC